ncbi:MFS transporter [Herbiconiux sp. SYSU D00978]|uniref:MFS transporter n=1 Tax=Herbiconiux sp. SYSU D00978 TaxID=2812562 RepID=UPI001A97B9E5|nr:MFS transporter [Herbiconiux sp. SYSU D00978]
MTTALLPPKATTRAWAGLAVLMLPVLLVSVDNTVLSFALPQIALELRPSAAMQLWIIDIYPLALSGLLVAMGSLGDRIGRRRLLLIGSAGFAAVSVLAAFSTSAEMLVLARLLLGVFGAALMPCTLSLIRGMFEDRSERRLAIAIWATGFAAGSAIGPIAGGLLLEHAPWGAVFLIAVPVLLPLFLLAPWLIKESKDPAPGPIDPVGILLSMLTLAPIVFAIKHVATHGVDTVAIIAALVGVAAGAAFVRRMLRVPTPMLDVRLFTVPAFTGSVLVNLVSVVSLVGLLYYLPQHLQLVEGLSPLQAGLVLVPGTVGMVVAGLLAVRLVRRVRPAVVMAGGLVLSAVAFALIAVAGTEATLLLLMVAFAILSIGDGAAQTLSNDMIVSSAPAAKAGAASAISETAYEAGAVIGTSVLGGVLTATYRAQLDVPAGVAASEADAARETLAGALQVARELPADLAAALTESARHAFDAGVVITSGVGAALMAVAVVLTLTLLRRARD